MEIVNLQIAVHAVEQFLLKNSIDSLKEFEIEQLKNMSEKLQSIVKIL